MAGAAYTLSVASKWSEMMSRQRLVHWQLSSSAGGSAARGIRVYLVAALRVFAANMQVRHSSVITQRHPWLLMILTLLQ